MSTFAHGCTLAILAAVAVSACDSPAAPDPDPPCATPPCPAVWRAADNPHRLDGTVDVPQLTIEAGSVIEAGPEGRLSVLDLKVTGTADAPVRFRASVPGGTWRGIDVCCWGSEGVIRHAVIEGAGVGVSNGRLRVEDTTIRGAPGAGIFVGLRSILFIRGGSIEDNAGIGIASVRASANSGGVIFEAPVRITGNGSYGLAVPLAALQGVLSSQEGWDAIQGNARDTVLADWTVGFGSSSYLAAGPPVLRSGAVLRMPSTCLTQGVSYALVMEPGARLLLTGEVACPPGTDIPVRLTMNGRADDPVHITSAGSMLSVTAADTVRIRHAVVRGLLFSVRNVPAVIEDVQFDSVQIDLRSAGTRMVRTSITHARRVTTLRYPGQPVLPPIRLATGTRLEHTHISDTDGDGVTIAGHNVVMSDCTIRGSTGHGVNVLEGSAVIARCNLEQNAGAGVRNSGSGDVDARHNWWGDPAGPLAPNGDGVEGTITYIPFSSVRLGIPGAAARNVPAPHH